MSSIESVLTENRVFPPSEAFVKNAAVSGMEAYKALRAQAEQDYTGFWANLAREEISWQQPFTQVLDESNAPFFRWFYDGKLNASYNCLDRHLATRGDKTAIIFEADDGSVTKVSYQQLHQRVCRFANALKAQGIGLGDRVIIYLPMSIQAVIAMQACARIGAIHSVVFGGFSAKSLHERITDVGAKLVITADGQFRGGKAMPLKPAVDEALTQEGCEGVEKVIVYQRTGGEVAWNARDIWWHDAEAGQGDTCEPVWVEAEHPLFILYTSGSTGKPKGVAIEHRSLVSFLHWVRDTFSDAELSGVLASTSTCFDLSVFEIFGPLSWGGRVVLANSALDLWSSSSPTDAGLINTVPSVLAELLRGRRLPPSVHTVNLAGEPLRQPLVETIFKETNARHVNDLYGPSETTIYSSWTRRKTGGVETVGRPIANTQLYILDTHGQPLPVGISGELHIGGVGVARGYWRRPDLT
ncbi:MAG: AMP-binding protein, partial [Methylophilaceae bacterium]